MINIKEMGAVADGSTDNTAAIQKALDRCGEAGGGTVLIPPGTLSHGRFIFATTLNSTWPTDLFCRARLT